MQRLPLTEVLSCFNSHDFLRIGIFILGVRPKLKQSKKELIFRAPKLHTNAARNGDFLHLELRIFRMLQLSYLYHTLVSQNTFFFFFLIMWFFSSIVPFVMKYPFPVHRGFSGSPQSSLSHPVPATPLHGPAAPWCWVPECPVSLWPQLAVAGLQTFAFLVPLCSIIFRPIVQ